MEKRKELFRLVSLTLLLGLLMACFVLLLFDLQVIHHADYLARTVKAVGRTETVPAARGELTDRYGRPLVTNQVIYQATLDTALMGEDKNTILLDLMALARERDVTWPDNLPLSRQAPYTLTLDSLTESARKNFDALCKAMNWTVQDGPGLLATLRSAYKLPKELSDADARDLCGVLYELSLRSKEVLWSEYIFADHLDMDFITAVRERSLTGVIISPVTTRKYATTYAAHILGRTGKMDSDEWKTFKELGYAMNEVVGKDGVERAFESLLRGQAGTQVVERNAKGKMISQHWTKEPQPGYNVALTIDLPLQQKVEDVLAAKLPTLSDTAKGGAAVVIDVNTADVLAMASYPTYDLTTIYKDTQLYQEAAHDPLDPFNNRATLGLYAPGSTFKPMVAIAALEEGVIEPNTRIRDTGLYTYYRSPQPACWIYRQYRSTHGLVNVTRAIEVSCNVFFYDTGRRLGIQRMGEYARKFGLGMPTGIELPEKQGVVAGPEYTESQGKTWYDGSTLSAAIGQENNQFTPLQMANYTATLANGGTHRAAHLLKNVKSSDYSQVVETYQPQVLDTIDISPENLAAVKQGMLDLTTTGSLGSYFRGLDFQVGAKTGSVQVSGATSTATFICFAPYDDPQVAMAIVAEAGGSGSGLAALAAEILDYYFSSQSGFGTAVEENTLLR